MSERVCVRAKASESKREGEGEGEREVKGRKKGRKEAEKKKGGYYNYAVLHKKNQTDLYDS